MRNEKLIVPGAPGTKARWNSSAKFGLRRAIYAASKIAFTLSNSILNAVNYPHDDIACTRDIGLIVIDGKDFISEEKRPTRHQTKMPGCFDGNLAFKNNKI